MLFVDVRGSTTMAERMSATEFSGIMHRFFKAATDVLIDHDRRREAHVLRESLYGSRMG
jgi:class 3 adenylate cyclase